MARAGRLAGVCLARRGEDRNRLARRSYGDALALDPLPIDDAVADAWAKLRITLRQHGLKMPANDSWIAAAAIAHDLPLATQDADYDGMPGLTVIKL